ncbi:MAG: serine/threonine-protein kinase [Sandaracinaceae bacterium]
MGAPHQKHVPTVYGRYQTLFRIAAGGMAEVYAARVRGEAGFEKLVALKRMLPHLTDDDRFVSMFMDEGQLAANITSPNVVSTLDLGRADDGSLYLVMELVVGTTLSGLLRNAARSSGTVSIDVGVELLAQASQGLHDAHEAMTPSGERLEIVHRDVSPQNILVGTDGRVRITDFGVARAVLRRTKTSTGEFKGKLSYFSPEQCADKDLDRRSDIFSLGVVAWETLTTRRLFHAENPLAVLERVTRMQIPSAHLVRPEIPEAVAAVVAKALERDRDLRFGTASEFATALREAAQQTCGVADRHAVSALVQEFGGDSLERVQSKLKESLANPPPFEPSGVREHIPLEDASGIMVRDESDSAISRVVPPPPPRGATPRPGTFVGDPEAVVPPPQSRMPLVIATFVATLGLGGGAAIAMMAMQENNPAPTAIGAESTVDPVLEEPPPEVVVPVTPEEPEEPQTPEPVVEEPTPEASPERRRPNRRRGTHRRGGATTRPPAPEVRPLPPAPAPTPPPMRPTGTGGMVGLESWD